MLLRGDIIALYEVGFKKALFYTKFWAGKEPFNMAV